MRLGDVITSVAELRQRRLESEDIELRVEDQSKQHVLAVMTELQQVVLNFVVNAEQAIVMSGRRPGRITLRTRDEGDRVILEVEDTGPGVPHDNEAKLFQPFFTTKPVGQGTGLGLSVSYGIIDSLGGHIGYRRAPAGGAIFYFDLPAASAEPVTNRLYYTDPSCRRFDATVTRAFDHDGRPAVTLDRTAFYPSSGGQPFDTGRLGGTDVVDTIDDGDEVIHVLASPLAHGASVTGEIDWTRRFDHMQQHTGQHILSGAFETLFDNLTVGFHMGAEVSTIDLAREASPAEIERGVDESNRIVWEDRPVVDPLRVEGGGGEPVRSGRNRSAKGTLRLIDISGFDLCACGGTHVDRTGAIGLIAVLGAERMRGGSRLTFVCGARALRALRTYRDAVAGSVTGLVGAARTSCPLPSNGSRTNQRSCASRRRAFRTSWRSGKGRGWRRRLRKSNGVRLVVDALDGWDVAGLKALAAAATASARACVVLVTAAQPVSIVVACSPTVSIDANAVLQQLTHRFGGRGGGKPGLAQGGGLAAPAQEIVAAARTLIESMLAL